MKHLKVFFVILAFSLFVSVSADAALVVEY